MQKPGDIVSMKRSKVVFFSICSLLLFALLFAAYNNAKQAKIQDEVNEAANKIYKNLPIPQDSVFLGQVKNDHLLIYAKGCTGTVIEAAYGSNRSLTEILNEYGEHLTASGWELSSNNKIAENFAFYSKGPSAEIHILPDPVNVPVRTLQTQEERFKTIYAITILYTIPSSGGHCLY